MQRWAAVLCLCLLMPVMVCLRAGGQEDAPPQRTEWRRGVQGDACNTVCCTAAVPDGALVSVLLVEGRPAVIRVSAPRQDGP